MNKDVIIRATLIQEIRDDGSVVSGDAMFFNPQSVVWMKSRALSDLRLDYTIIKLKETEPFLAEGSLYDYAEAMGCEVDTSLGWAFDDDDDDD